MQHTEQDCAPSPARPTDVRGHLVPPRVTADTDGDGPERRGDGRSRAPTTLRCLRGIASRGGHCRGRRCGSGQEALGSGRCPPCFRDDVGSEARRAVGGARNSTLPRSSRSVRRAGRRHRGSCGARVVAPEPESCAGAEEFDSSAGQLAISWNRSGSPARRSPVPATLPYRVRSCLGRRRRRSLASRGQDRSRARAHRSRTLRGWAWMDLNHRPLPYQGSALTELSYRPRTTDARRRAGQHGQD